MSFAFSGLSALSVALLYYSWRGHSVRSDMQQRLLRHRVAYLLWVVAHGSVE